MRSFLLIAYLFGIVNTYQYIFINDVTIHQALGWYVMLNTSCKPEMGYIAPEGKQIVVCDQPLSMNNSVNFIEMLWKPPYTIVYSCFRNFPIQKISNC
jgi:hypothetical protein